MFHRGLVHVQTEYWYQSESKVTVTVWIHVGGIGNHRDSGGRFWWAILVGLLLPVIQAARGAARHVQ
ncbi:hypothetical protein OAE21_00820 [Rubripirellula sp.]|nr:hypothetical protein [Rubripirellula sp.]MDB4624593.1 hypothetical protein [Rubripirellula sp.]